MESVPIQAIAEVIQLAVAPVFLLTGIAGFLSVLSHRLSRVVDRTRVVKRFMHGVESVEERAAMTKESDSLAQRTLIINWAIRIAVGSALLISIVVMCLFVGDLGQFNLGSLIAWLFVSAMVLIVMSLLLLIAEVTIHTRIVQNDIEHLLVELRD